MAGAEVATLPRAIGRVRVAVRADGATTRLADLFQEGAAKCLLPRGTGVEAVLLNTAGGLTGGDRIAWEAVAGPGASLTVTTQAAERAYRAAPACEARVRARLRVGSGASLAWLPQETILYDRSALHRRLEAEIAADARLTLLEPVVLGRAAMGEAVAAARFSDRWQVWRHGRLVFADAVRFEGDLAAVAARPPSLGPGRHAFATLAHLAPDAEDRLPALRAALPGAPCLAGASAWEGCLVARIVAPDGRALRAALGRSLLGLGLALPRVWRL